MIVSSIVFFLEAVITMLWMFPIVDERKSQIVCVSILLITLGVTNYYNVAVLGWGTILILINLYVLFYAVEYEHFIIYSLLRLVIFVLIAVSLSFNKHEQLLQLLPIIFFSVMYVIQLVIKGRRKLQLLLGVIFFSIIFFYSGITEYENLMVIASFIFIIFVEEIYSGLSKNFIKNTKEFQNQVMVHHYEEVKAIYLNMRGWRHDYHNHIQSMKSILALHNYVRLGNYLGELEADLSEVDNLV